MPDRKLPTIFFLSFPYYLATTLQPPLPTESSAEYNGDREYFYKFFWHSEQNRFERRQVLYFKSVSKI